MRNKFTTSRARAVLVYSSFFLGPYRPSLEHHALPLSRAQLLSTPHLGICYIDLYQSSFHTWISASPNFLVDFFKNLPPVKVLWILTNVTNHLSTTPVLYRTVWYPKKKFPMQQLLCWQLPSSPPALGSLWSICHSHSFAFSITSWNPTVYSLLSLASFTLARAFKIHPYCMNWWLISFHC